MPLGSSVTSRGRSWTTPVGSSFPPTPRGQSLFGLTGTRGSGARPTCSTTWSGSWTAWDSSRTDVGSPRASGSS
eukprot:8254642-Pyramimonas_sp.AAC.1